MPINPVTLETAGITDQSIWMDYEKLASIKPMMPDDIGFGIAINPPYFVIDIDYARSPDTGQWSELSQALLQQFPGAYSEVSTSGNGLHIIGRTTKQLEHKCKNLDLKIECYTENRLIKLTGNRVDPNGNWETDLTSSFEAAVNTFFPPKKNAYNHQWTSEPLPEWSGPDDDKELIEKALDSKSAGATFGGKASFTDLWNGNVDVLAGFYPSEDPEKPYDGSSADLALCSHLAFWTGKNCERIERLFNQSGLVRDKWLKREDYRKDTILQAINNCKNVYSNQKPEPTSEGIRHGFQGLTIDEQIKYFSGCAYITDVDKVVTPDGLLLNKSQFRAVYGGYVFYIDALHDKTTRNAFEAFTENQAYDFPKCNSTFFDPLQAPGIIIEREGKKLYNVWRPIDVPCVQGDVSPFTFLIERLLPDQRDREILLSYAAACVRYQGIKFQWWPVLQGTQGNGKTFVAYAIMNAIGETYSHIPKASDISNKFNAWVENKTFLFVDEIDVSDNREVLDNLKPLVSNERIEMQSKGLNQRMIVNIANGFMCMNHRDGIRRNANERRYCIFFTAQQYASDLERDGLDSVFFTNLWKWAKNGGFAHITYFLKHYPINPLFNPADGCTRAPETSKHNEILQESYSDFEREMIDLVSDGVVGCCGGYISSHVVKKVIEDNHFRMNGAIVSAKLRNMGYMKHPVLNDGRASFNCPWDNTRPRIYVHKDNVMINCTDARQVTEHFYQSQEDAIRLNRHV